jgi:hypothetical protein
MNAREVEIGSIYAVKVSGRIVPVRIERASAGGGWHARNVSTGRGVRIKTAAKLRRKIEPTQKGGA